MTLGGGDRTVEGATPSECRGSKAVITFSHPPISALFSITGTWESASAHNREMERRWTFSSESSMRYGHEFLLNLT